MTEQLACLDTNILVSYLTPEGDTREAIALLGALLEKQTTLIAPAFAWAEFGSVLRKKLRRGAVLPPDAEEAWQEFLKLPITFTDTLAMRVRAWELAGQFGLPTLYDAAFLACAELGGPREVTAREFWTADVELVKGLADARPDYVRLLGE